MHFFCLALRLFASGIVVVSALHLFLGLGAEALLGAAVPPAAYVEPSLDSQNRFYGVSFALYAGALYLCSRDLPRFEPLLKLTLIIFFLGGLARLVSWAARGAPTFPIVVLACSELLLPPLLWLWYARVRSAEPPDHVTGELSD